MDEKTITAWMPVGASAKFSMKKPKGWNEMKPEQKAYYFYENAMSDSSLCHQCSNGIESDFETLDCSIESLVEQFT